MRSNRGAFELTIGVLPLSGAVQAQIWGGYVAPLRLTSSVASTTIGAFDGTSTGLNGVGVSGTGGSGASSAGVFGVANAGRGVFGRSNTGDGVFGEITGPLDVNGIRAGVVGEASNGNGVRGFSHNGVGVFGEGTFDVGVYGMSDNDGEWFEALNRDFRYQLTCIGGAAPVNVADEVNEGHFRIAGGTPGLKVSWQLTGVRKDAFAVAHPLVVEAGKTADERGRYLHPVAMGAPASLSVDRTKGAAIP